ncbi:MULTISPECIES: cytochrome c oxidase subunit I [Candidatus Ichthyocystis]|uniref:cytochrome c oxidase subunit I n=1 Tax=Candidatus Ichthyocystis TaxID=2929841 RepID=UPI000A72ED42|nr:MULTISPECIES: cytochrome c oxidase subunit I [Ichthyocystis]
MSSVVLGEESHGDHHGASKKGIVRWLTTTNHKDIGLMYLIFGGLMFFVGGAFAMLIRYELLSPGLRLIRPELYNQLVTMHGLVMIFGAVMPAFTGFANLNLPMMLGASDMAFARLNNWSFWLLIPAALLLVLAFFVHGGAPATGWTLYPPLSIQMGPGMDMVIFAVHILGISSVLGSINIIVTILNMRAPGMSMMQIPMFAWTMLVTAYLLVAVVPVLAGGVTMLLFDRHFGTSFFNAAGGGDPILYQHIFWFFGHPEVYIIALPAFGIVSQIIPAFSRKPLFGYKSMVFATLAIAIQSFLVWAHHMFTVGMPAAGQLFFMYATMIIAVPTGVKVFNWIFTMWGGSLTFESPMLFAIGFIALFVTGGFSGIVLANTPVDVQVHNTYYVIAHFHYVLVSGALFAIFGGCYFWFPKWSGRMYNEFWGKFHFWCSVISFNIAFFPMHFLGLAGMPRHYPDYNPMFTDFNQVASVGSFMFGLSQVIFLLNMVYSCRNGPKSVKRPWEGAKSLEWLLLDCPAEYHSFIQPPAIPKEYYEEF